MLFRLRNPYSHWEIAEGCGFLPRRSVLPSHNEGQLSLLRSAKTSPCCLPGCLLVVAGGPSRFEDREFHVCRWRQICSAFTCSTAALCASEFKMWLSDDTSMSGEPYIMLDACHMLVYDTLQLLTKAQWRPIWSRREMHDLCIFCCYKLQVYFVLETRQLG